MITLNKLVKSLLRAMTDKGEVNGSTSPRAMSIRISRSWRRFDACHPARPPLHLTRDFVRPLHRNDASFESEFSEKEELAADIIIDTALALEQAGCGNIEQVIKDRMAWRMNQMGAAGESDINPPAS